MGMSSFLPGKVWCTLGMFGMEDGSVETKHFIAEAVVRRLLKLLLHSTPTAGIFAFWAVENPIII